MKGKWLYIEKVKGLGGQQGTLFRWDGGGVLGWKLIRKLPRYYQFELDS